jgi:hypothetical protein
VYFGLSARLQLLDVAFFSLALHHNEFTHCTVSTYNIVGGGNLYGGGASVYMGGYSLSLKSDGPSSAAAGPTMVRNVSIGVDAVTFTSCSASHTAVGAASGNNVYGGSFSFYVGAYAWSFSGSTVSRSNPTGLTTVSGVNVTISNVNSSDCSTITTGILGANSYGGSMSVVYIGAYAWSSASGFFSHSDCGTTNVAGLIVSISSSTFADSSAVSRTCYNARFFSFL